MSTTQNRWPPMGQLLVERGQVTSAQLEAALVEQQDTGERLGEILVKHEHISRFDLASALQTQWTWRDEAPDSAAPRAPTQPPPEHSVEPGPVAAASEGVVPDEETPATPVPSPEYLSADGAPANVSTLADPGWTRPPSPDQALLTPTAEEPAPVPVGTEAFAALVGRVSSLEDQETLLRELRTHLRETREQLVAGEARLGALEAILSQFSQTYAALNARLDAQTREIEELRRVTAEQATRITTAGRALLG